MNLLEVSPADYHTKLTCNRANVLAPDSYLSKSVIWELAGTSLYSWRYFPKKFAPSDAMQWGSLIDCLTTTPELVDDMVAVSPYDAFRSNEAKEWKAEQLKAGKIITKPAEFFAVQRAAENLLVKHSLSAEIFAKSKKQVIIGGRILDVNVKGLLDLAPVGEDYLADLKTASDFSTEGLARTVAKFGYHMQSGLYLAIWNAMFPDDQRHRFLNVWQKSKSPSESFEDASYEVTVTEQSSDDIERGFEYAEHLIKRIVAATNANHWPMLGEGVVPILGRPAWSGIQEEAKIEADQEQPIERREEVA